MFFYFSFTHASLHIKGGRDAKLQTLQLLLLYISEHFPFFDKGLLLETLEFFEISPFSYKLLNF